MAFRKAEHSAVEKPSARAWANLLKSMSLRRTQIVTWLAGAALMAAAGAWAGSQLRLDDLELRPVRGPRLRVSPVPATAKLASLDREATAKKHRDTIFLLTADRRSI